MRSIKKGPFISTHLIKKIQSPNNSIINTWSRTSIIVPFIIGCTIAIYNGVNLIPIFITETIIGYKLGEFFSTHIRCKNKK